MVAVSAVICTIVGTFLFTSVFAQIDSKQYFSPDDNSNSTNAVREEIDVVRISIEEGAPSLGDRAFSPDITNVSIGSNVTWINNDSQFHTITSGIEPDDPIVGQKFESEALSPKETFSYISNETGTFSYFCQLHPTMKGKLIVS
jgi:plastocyanin